MAISALSVPPPHLRAVGWRFSRLALGAPFVTTVLATLRLMSLAASWDIQAQFEKFMRLGEAQARFGWITFAALDRRMGSASATTMVGPATIAGIMKTSVFNAIQMKTAPIQHFHTIWQTVDPIATIPRISLQGIQDRARVGAPQTQVRVMVAEDAVATSTPKCAVPTSAVRALASTPRVIGPMVLEWASITLAQSASMLCSRHALW